MNRIEALLRAIEEGRREFQRIMNSSDSPVFRTEEIYGKYDDCSGPCTIADGDNLEYMQFLLRERDMAGKIQLIYLDPPFFSNSRYQASVNLYTDRLGKSPVIKTGAYDDRWSGSIERYLSMLAVRLMVMRELLSDTGCIWVHLDWHGSHYVKMLMDEIFGQENFVNEVIWTYKSGGASRKSFARKHDNLLFYAKSKNYKFHPVKEKSYNRGLKPYRFKGVEEFQDEIGWYTLVNMKDVWSLDMVGRTSAERTGYATQKPEKLLERIISCCSDEGDICADFFSGSGTLGAACSSLNRPWIMCDEGNVAISSQILRMSGTRAFEEGCTAFEVVRNEEHKDQGNGSVDFSTEMGCLRLTAYKPDSFGLNEKDEEVAAEYIKDDGRSAVSFWSMDSSYDGKVHRADTIHRAGDFSLESCERPHALGYDVFGNRFQWGIIPGGEDEI